MRRKAYALIVESGRLLLVRYYFPAEQAWYWNFPGGTQEPGESLEQTVRRELREECCVDIAVGTLVYTDTPAGRDYERNFFRCEITEGRPRVSDNPATNDSIAAVEWVPLENPGYAGGWGRRNLPPVIRALGPM